MIGEEEALAEFASLIKKIKSDYGLEECKESVEHAYYRYLTFAGKVEKDFINITGMMRDIKEDISLLQNEPFMKVFHRICMSFEENSNQSTVFRYMFFTLKEKVNDIDWDNIIHSVAFNCENRLEEFVRTYAEFRKNHKDIFDDDNQAVFIRHEQEEITEAVGDSPPPTLH